MNTPTPIFASIDEIPLAANHPALAAQLMASGASRAEVIDRILKAEGDRQGYRSDSGTATQQTAAAANAANTTAQNNFMRPFAAEVATAVELATRAKMYQSKVRGEGRKITIIQAINELELQGQA